MQSWLAVLAVASGLSCANLPEPVSMEPPRIGEPPRPADDPAKEKAYQTVLRKYSDTREVYATLDTRAFLGATFQSADYREARTRYVGMFEHLPPEKLEAKLAEERGELAASHAFFVSAYMHDYHYDDLDTPRSVWRVALIANGVEVLPEKVERIGRANLRMRSVYPYIGEFWTAYWFRFPKKTADGKDTIPEGTDKVTLRFASVLGTAELTFPPR